MSDGKCVRGIPPLLFDDAAIAIIIVQGPRSKDVRNGHEIQDPFLIGYTFETGFV